ncbi:TetR/AcrR family transcriptional regulator [Actinokineospora sp. PR83]|uniref:TetR/AcrR family transcriptional regulator n=1 Tax=Actinokineospora sp. PR83 TaxID=2884908 RepID=UPI0027DF21F5|nr:TetR/AcrR family transcriptional regulator [Actinokineospora sp. PR83]MCG8918648.1 TetR/AcrR family transcriptional regulator [Actinokineospora sp. PR83]
MASPDSRLRADARDNRDRIVRVARDTFAERGIDVPMAAIARRAGVGVATLYRRFPTKESLVAAAFAERMAHCAVLVEEGLADPDPWRGFTAVLERVCAMQALDRGLTSALMTAFPDALDFATHRTRALSDFMALTRRAQQAGRLRADFGIDDLTMLLMANSGLVTDSPEAALAASRRLVAWFLQSCRAEHAEELPPPVPLGLGHLFRPR